MIKRVEEIMKKYILKNNKRENNIAKVKNWYISSILKKL